MPFEFGVEVSSDRKLGGLVESISISLGALCNEGLSSAVKLDSGGLMLVSVSLSPPVSIGSISNKSVSGGGASGRVGGGPSGSSGGRESGILGTDPLELVSSRLLSAGIELRGSNLASGIGEAFCAELEEPKIGRLSGLKLSSCSCSLFLVHSSFHCSVRKDTFDVRVCDLGGVLVAAGSVLASSEGGGRSGIGGGGAGGRSSSSLSDPGIVSSLVVNGSIGSGGVSGSGDGVTDVGGLSSCAGELF